MELTMGAGMAKRCVALLGTASIQQYIFRSNRLKENVGASHLVSQGLDRGLTDAMDAAGCRVDRGEWDGGPVPSSGAANRVIYIGGGNALIDFANEDTAHNAVFAWSKALLSGAPGLRVAAGYAPYEPGGMATAFQAALRNLQQCESDVPFGSPLFALPVVRTCATTGQPASEIDRVAGSNAYVSSETKRKREQVGTQGRPGPALEAANTYFADALQEGDWQFPIELEHLGGAEGESHIAVVHADGNGIGELLRTVSGEGAPMDDEVFVDRMRAFSRSMTAEAQGAFVRTVKALGVSLRELEARGLVVRDKQLPIRPIVYGGDDITFVCDGRLGLALAEKLLREIATAKVDVCGSGGGESAPLAACAGVAIVPTKFPFAAAYGIAEELCASAKSARREQIARARAAGHGVNSVASSWIDFQAVLSSEAGSVAAERARKYRSRTGEPLVMRPIPLGRAMFPDEQLQPYWNELFGSVEAFQEWPRSRAKGLLRALAGGPLETKLWLSAAARHVELPPSSLQLAQAFGWSANRTPYFDALEVSDFHLGRIP